MARDRLNHGKSSDKSKKLNSVKNSKRDPQRVDGIFTKNKIKLSAIKLFSQKRFSEVSISQISKAANISAGAFYQYYVNKDELFRDIVEEIFNELSSTINGVSLTEVGIKFLNFGFQNRDLVKVIHLNEYSFDWIRHEYDNILRKISKTFELTSIGHFYFWSPLKFVVAFADLLEINLIPGTFVYFLISGIIENCNEKANMEKMFQFQATRHFLGEDERREQILANAESLFGLYGFEKTQVYDIARASGVAVGTIYLYFENKLEILRELVRWISKGLRYNVKRALEMCEECDRLVKEIAGLYAFVKFFKMHFNMYKIVRESQSIDKDIAKEYYSSIYKPYLKALKESFKNGTLNVKKTSNYNEAIEYLVLMLMSFGHYIGEKYLLDANIEDEKSENIEDFLRELYVYLCHGLEVTK